MSIRPFDVQMMVQKAPEVSKPAIAENQHYSSAQQNVADKFTKETLLNNERVLVIDRSESETVNEDGRGGAEYRRRKHQQRERRENDDKSEDTGSENRFDVSI